MKSLWNEFIRYAVPSVIGMMVSALYVVVDGIFVGRGVRERALASINVALPLTTLMIAITMMITMGGAELMSIRFGENKVKEGNNIFLQSLFLIFVISGLLSIIGVFYPVQLAKMLGASNDLLKGTADYICYYLAFGIGFSVSLSLSVFVRNDGNPNLAMISLIIGAVTNIFLDYIFIFILNYGVSGAAVASGLGQLSSVFLLITHFLCKKGKLKLYIPKLNKGDLLKILKVGMPEFIVQISPAISIFIFNQVIMKRIGEIGIAGFSIIGYISVILIALFIGISQGIQPLLSYNYGKNNLKKVNDVFNLGLKTNFIASVVIYLLLLIYGYEIISIFNENKMLIKLTYNALIIYSFSFIIASINIVNVTYYQSTEKSYIANIVSISRGMIFTLIFIIILPFIIGDLGIWYSIVIGEICTLLIIIYLKKENLKSI